MSKQDYDFIIEELKKAGQNTYIQHVHETLSKDDIVERTNMAYEQIEHVLSKLI